MGTLQKLAERLGRSPARRAGRLRAECSAAGEGLRVDGSPVVENEGTLTLGSGVGVNARFAPTRLKVGPGGVLRVGDDVEIGFGSVLSASLEISIGNRVSLGPYVFVVDANMGDPDLGAESSGAVPIIIGDDVELGSRVTVLKGSRIGQGARIMAGSVVAGTIPAYAVASGNPAQVVRAARPRLVHEMLLASAALHADKPAVISGSRELTYTGLSRRAHAIAAALAGAGVRTGDPVLILASAKADFIAAFYGTLELGAVAVPVPEGAARATVTDLADASGARVLVTDGPMLATFSPPLDEKTFTLVRLEAVPQGAAPPRVEHAIAAKTPALIMFTSGTTAKKKAVLLSHENLVQATLNINEFIKIDERVREFVAVPLYHSFGLGRVRAVLAVGGTLVLNDGHLNAAAMIQAIEGKRANALSTVPAGLSMFSGKLEAPLRRIGPQIEVIELGSAFMSPDEKARLLDVFPRARVCMHYGLTEASRSTFLEFRRESQKLSTVGRPAPNVTIEIHDPEGRARPAGEQGEIVVRGAHVTLGYFRDEERTSAAFTADGAFRTGDFGFLDPEGYLHLLGRKDEIINRGGIKISPLELEEKLSEAYPDVEMCVVGVPDPTGLAGEIPVLAYTGTIELLLSDVLSALSQKVERNKLPHSIVKVESIPRTANGKPMRRVLREQLATLGEGG
jgi:acyl-CoA synthetase (AMP-forming)/AMP-acid ligase II/acetyltransferase-like isoleucine patch superfamily enzyme